METAHEYLHSTFWVEYIFPSFRDPIITEAFLTSGMDKDTTTTEGITPLMYCAHVGYEESLRVLLAKGADVHAESKRGYTALDMAVDMGNVECVLLLLQHDATLKVPEEQPYQSLRGLIYLLREGGLFVDLLRVLGKYLFL